MTMPDLYKNIAQFQNSTVALKYEPKAKNATAYESEARMEDRLIAQLKAQGYGAPDIRCEADLIANLRRQLERLNGVSFTDAEWKRFFDTELAKATNGIVEKTRMIQDRDTAISFTFDDGISRNIRLLNKKDVPRNYLQVINYRETGTVKAGGYVWHTTGSGKTLTSYKTAQLLSQKDYIDKVLFVVDHKDLDYQTMKEYNRFEKDAVNGNKSTAALQRQLENMTVTPL